MGGLSPAPAPAPAPSYAAGLAAAAAGVGAFALAALAWPCALLAALVAGPGPLRTLRCELNDRWWWGAYGLGATPAERRTSFLLKAQVFVLARLPWAVLRRFDGRMAAFGFTSKTWEAQKAMDRMPTVKRGLEALGMTSVMEWKYRPHEISLTPSPWTHEPSLPPPVPGGEMRRTFRVRRAPRGPGRGSGARRPGFNLKRGSRGCPRSGPGRGSRRALFFSGRSRNTGTLSASRWKGRSWCFTKISPPSPPAAPPPTAPPAPPAPAPPPAAPRSRRDPGG